MPKHSLAYKISQGLIQATRQIPKTICTCKDPVPYRVLKGQIVYCLVCNLAIERLWKARS